MLLLLHVILQNHQTQMLDKSEHDLGTEMEGGLCTLLGSETLQYFFY